MKVSKPARVLILYVSAVSGHRRAAEAISEALAMFHPDVQVHEVNLFQHGNSLVRCLLDSLYYAVIRLTPWLWDLIWDSKAVYWLTYLVRNVLYELNYHRLYREVVVPYEPDAVVCTHNIACALCSRLKRRKAKQFLLAAVPTDFDLHPYWYYPGVDLYLLPVESQRTKLVARGASPSRIEVTGIPVSLGFCRSDEPAGLRRKWDLDPEAFTVLVMGGALGLGPMERVVEELSAQPVRMQVVVVTGINRQLKRRLDSLSARAEIPVKVWGFVKEIHELMAVSNLLISKPGGLTTAEALCRGLPIGIVDSLAGQERRNRQLLLESGMAFDLHQGKSIGKFVAFLSNGSFDREQWRRNTRRMARPDASRLIADAVMNRLRKRYRGEQQSGVARPNTPQRGECVVDS